MIDANRLGDVWDLSTDVVKRIVPRDSFVQQVTGDRARLGTPTARGEAVVTRTQFQWPSPPPSPTTPSRCASWCLSAWMKTRSGACRATACVDSAARS